VDAERRHHEMPLANAIFKITYLPSTMIALLKYRNADACIYPGAYEPIRIRETGFEEEWDKINASLLQAPVNIIRMDDHYKIEMPAAGFEREDFTIVASGHRVIIKASTDKANAAEGRHCVHRGYNRKNIQRSLELPEDADTEYATASYQQGILCLYFCRNAAPRSTIAHTDIVVY
jgi:HSP20 family molecular chaperone IbpA